MDNDFTKGRHKWSTLIGVPEKGRRRGGNQRTKSEKSGGRGRVVEEIG